MNDLVDAFEAQRANVAMTGPVEKLLVAIQAALTVPRGETVAELAERDETLARRADLARVIIECVLSVGDLSDVDWAVNYLSEQTGAQA
jgi:hypothetical protein